MSSSHKQEFSKDLERIRFAMNAAGIGVWEVDLPTNTLIWDERCCEFVGLRGAHVLAFSEAFQYIHPDDLGWVSTAIQNALSGANNGLFDATYRTIGADQVLRWVNFTGTAQFDDAAQAMRFGGVARDVTERHTIAQKIDQSREQLLSLFEQSPVALATITREGLAFTFANDFYCELVGRKPADILHKPLLEALPEVAGQGFDQLLQGVLDTGVPFASGEVAVSLMRAGKLETLYVNLTYQPIREEDGSIDNILVVATDVTPQVASRRKIEESEAHLKMTRNAVPAMIFYLDAEQRYQSYNEKFMDWYRVNATEAIGKTVLEFLGEAAHARALPYLEQAYGGQQVQYETWAPTRMGKDRWLGVTYTPDVAADGQVAGLIVHAADISQNKQTELALRESEQKFRALIVEAPVATCLFVGRDMRVEVANEPMLKTWGKTKAILGMRLEDAVPELKGQSFLDLLEEVFTTGKPYSASAARAALEVDGVLSTYYFNFTYKPLFNDAGEVYGIMNMAVDVTEQVMVRNALEESTAQMRTMIESAPFPIGVYIGREMRIRFANQNIKDVWGKGNDVEGKLYTDILPELATQEIFQQLTGVYDTGIAFHSGTRRVDIEHGGELVPYYFNYSFTPLLDASGKVYGVMNTAADVTELEMARRKLEENEAALRNAVELAELGTWSVNIATGDTTLSQQQADMFGLDVLNLSYEQVIAVIHPEDRDLVRNAITAATTPGSDGRYEAEYRIINARTGQTQIIHAQGETTFDQDGKPVRIAGTARDITIQRELQTALENEVQTRTEELNATNEELEEANKLLIHSNEELAQYAYVASHDLQEPLRKIQVFTGLLNNAADLDEKTRGLTGKISQSAGRMQSLIKDLLEFSRLLKSDLLMRPVDLNEVSASVLGDYELIISEQGAAVTIGHMPVIQAVALQMNQLFYNLLGNALKFAQPGRAPRIDIRSEVVSHEVIAPWIPKPLAHVQYHRITFTDNGIGFEAQYAEQIFEVFKRLHSRDAFAGSGIGLALCRRIAANHQGVLYAESEPGSGSSFYVILPDRQSEF